MDKASNNSDLSACACMNIRKASRQIAQFYDQRLQPCGLRNTQFTLLVMLGRLAPVSINQLANSMSMDRTTLTRNLRLLEKEALIVGMKGSDARMRLHSLTEKGKLAVKNAYPYWEQAQLEFLEKFGGSRWEGFLSELSAFSNAVKKD